MSDSRVRIIFELTDILNQKHAITTLRSIEEQYYSCLQLLKDHADFIHLHPYDYKNFLNIKHIVTIKELSRETIKWPEDQQ